MKLFVVARLILWATLVTRYSKASEDSIVRIEEGVVRGIKETSLLRKEFYSFLGVPYAKPPIGDLRFKDPIAVESWNGVLNTTSEPNLCLQYSFIDCTKEDKSHVVSSGQEDCLYLNVHTPKANDLHAKLPVMVFIHGGAFLSGGAQEYGPYVLLDEEIVLVILQYRLGVFGFLSTEDSLLPGNMGLKDQQLALKWVRRNILNFGGDPDKVTIFGESAGGASVHMHILSPGSKGLFKRAIIQSGTALCPWAMSEDHKTFAHNIGNAFQCSLEEGTETYLKCMQSIHSKFLLLYGLENFKWGISPAVMVPRVDGEVLPDRPEILLKQGRYNKVDIISGVTRDEGSVLNIIMCNNPSMVDSLNGDFEKAGPLSLLLENEPQSLKLTTEIFRHYFQKKKIKIKSAYDDHLTKMFDDRYVKVCHDLASVLHASDNDISVYLYQLDHLGQRSFADNFPNCDRNNWVTHADDLIYLFSGGKFLPEPLEKDEDLKMREIIVALWTNFAKKGVPSVPKYNVSWERATYQSFKYLSLLPEPVMMNDNMSESRKFWLSRKIKQITNLVPDERFSLPESQDKLNEIKPKREL